MSNRLGIILSKKTSNEVLDEIREKYGFDLELVNNPTIYSSLDNDEMFMNLHIYGENTGITCYEYYLSHYTDIEELIDVWGFDIYYSIITDNNEKWLLDAHKWTEIIKDLKYNYQIPKVGLMNFFVSELVEDLAFDKKVKEDVDISTMNAVTLMKFKCEKIYMFV